MAFIRMEVILPAMLFKKLGVPHTRIWRIIRPVKEGLQKRSRAFPRKKGKKATMVQKNMPEQVARAAAQIPHRNTPRNKNSSSALKTDMRIFKNILPRMYPQMRR